MSFVVASVVGSVASGGASLYGAQQSANAISGGSKRALRYQAVEADKNRAFQREMVDEQRADFAPWREAGQQALQTIVDGINTGSYDVPTFSYDDVDLNADPGYQFRMDAGRDVIENSAAVRGGTLSGAQIKALTRYGQDYGSQEFGAAAARHADEIDREGQRRHNRFNMLSMLSDRGLTAAGRQAGATASGAAQIGATNNNLIQSGGNLINNSGLAQAQGISGATQAVNQGLQNWLTYRNSQPAQPAPQSNYAPTTNSSNALRWNNAILD